VISFENGNRLVIKARDNSGPNIYVKRASLNSKKLNVNFITHKQMMSGGRLDFIMSRQPNKDRGTSPAAYPYSMSMNQ
jgi:putative alpha-1,2-mannosidase